MLEGYYGEAFHATDSKEKRLIAVQAALEIIKTSAASTTSYTGFQKIDHDSKQIVDAVGRIADAIQAALE